MRKETMTVYEYNRLDKGGLKKIGITFRTRQESDTFAEIVKTELEIRIGAEISKGLSEEQLDEFDRLVDGKDEELSDWLEKNVPDMNRKIHKAAGEFKRELINRRTMIDGVCDTYEMRINSTPVERIGLIPWGRSCGCLKRAGIDTVGELRSVPDLSKIKNLSPRCVDEIRTKLADFLSGFQA